MSLLRTAAKVGVATSVHGKVQRRQQNRWAAEDQAAAAAAAAAAPPAHFAPPPQGFQPPPPPAQFAPPPAPALDAIPDIERRIELLKQIAELSSAGILTPEEFAVQKARILG